MAKSSNAYSLNLARIGNRLRDILRRVGAKQIAGAAAFIRRPIPVWLVLPLFLLAAIPPVLYGSLSVPSGGSITDTNVSSASCVQTNSGGKYIYASCPPSPSGTPSPTASGAILISGSYPYTIFTSPSPTPLPSPTSGNGNCTWSGLTISCSTPTPYPSPLASSGMSVSYSSGQATFSVDNCSNAICRVKLAIGLGFQAGTVSTSTVFPTQPIVTYSTGQITALRAACASTDNGTTVIELDKNGSSIGTLTLGNGTTVSSGSITPASISAGDYILLKITAAGTAQNCGFIAEGWQNVQ